MALLNWRVLSSWRAINLTATFLQSSIIKFASHLQVVALSATLIITQETPNWQSTTWGMSSAMTCTQTAVLRRTRQLIWFLVLHRQPFCTVQLSKSILKREMGKKNIFPDETSPWAERRFKRRRSDSKISYSICWDHEAVTKRTTTKAGNVYLKIGRVWLVIQVLIT